MKGGAASPVRLVIATGLAIALVVAGVELHKQVVQARLVAIAGEAETQAGKDASMDAALLGALASARAACADDCGPRGQTAAGVAEVALAGGHPDRLAAGQRDLEAALKRDPSRADTWAWLALARAQADQNRADPPVLDALARSYQTGAYLTQEGPWRISFAARHWDRIAPALRVKVLDEAVWLEAVDPAAAAQADAAFSEPDAAFALDLRRAQVQPDGR